MISCIKLFNLKIYLKDIDELDLRLRKTVYKLIDFDSLV